MTTEVKFAQGMLASRQKFVIRGIKYYGALLKRRDKEWLGHKMFRRAAEAQAYAERWLGRYERLCKANQTAANTNQPVEVIV